MFSNIPAEKYLKQALKNGGEYADLFFEHSRKTSIVFEDKKIDSIISGIDSGVGLRVISNLKTTYGSTNDLSNASLASLATNISNGVKGKKNNQTIRLRKIKPKNTFIIKNPPNKIDPSQKVNLVQKANKLARSLHKKIVQVSIRYSDLNRHVEIANSLGEYVVSPKTLTSCSVTVTVSNGEEYFTGYDSIGGHMGYELFDDNQIEACVRKAVHRASLNLSAPRAKAGMMPVIISAEAGGTMVHEAVGHGLEADLACQGLSVYEGKIGEKLASPLVTVVDDPTLPQKRGSYSFDDEGVHAQRVVLIENGVLKDFMFDRLNAMKTGQTSNGHGRRESFEHRPIVRMTNTMILPGQDDPEEIVRSTDKGLFVKMMGGGQVNTVNGDFVFEVTEGYEIKNGRIGNPVRGATLTGNGPAVLKMIDKVGNDLGYSVGTCGKDGQDAPVSDAIPTIRIPEMVVGGIV